MNILHFDKQNKIGPFKVMNAVNNGPCHKRHATNQWKSNLDTYKAARIPFARNHDAAFHAGYGGEHSVDITAIFPNFDADPYDPASYDFACTDEYILITLEAGTETYYRLGQKIEHYIKKFDTIPPKDFHKWAVICEHIIRHYNEGWADGLHLNIRYWEIWNEPDLDDDDSPNKRCWGGTKQQFFDFYEIAATHLKSCFPNLKIGGPALAHGMEWADDFLQEMKQRNVPIDFFSWHIYSPTVERIMKRAETIHTLMVQNGYGDAESILNEWNYIKGWEADFVPSIETIIGMKGAAFNMAVMTAAQHSSIDMLMYYDARPTVFNGMFDFYTLRPLKGYYPFLWYGMLYDMEAEIACTGDLPENLYALAGVDAVGKALAVLTYYTDEEDQPATELSVDFGEQGQYEVYLLDEAHDAELVEETDVLTFTIRPNTCIMILEK